MNDRLYRSRSDRMLAGVAGGLADRFDLDPSVVRVLLAVITILSGGIFLLIYIVMAIVVPEEPLGAPGTGWPGTGSSGWSTSWSSAWPTAGGPAPDPAGPAPGAPIDPAPADTVALGTNGPGSASGDPSAAGFAAPASAAPSGPSAAGFAAPESTPPGSGAPPAGGWSTPTGAWSDDSARSSRRAARDARRAARRATRGDRSGAGGIVAGLFLVALGAYFLVRTFAPEIAIDRFWPAGLIVLGVVLVALSIRRTAGPGAP